jgi:hypothetical protein
MNIQEIRKIMEEEGGKIIIPGEDSPTLIIMTLDNYRKEKEVKHQNKTNNPPKELEKESLTIEDLPFN